MHVSRHDKQSSMELVQRSVDNDVDESVTDFSVISSLSTEHHPQSSSWQHGDRTSLRVSAVLPDGHFSCEIGLVLTEHWWKILPFWGWLVFGLLLAVGAGLPKEPQKP